MSQLQMEIHSQNNIPGYELSLERHVSHPCFRYKGQVKFASAVYFLIWEHYSVTRKERIIINYNNYGKQLKGPTSSHTSRAAATLGSSSGSIPPPGTIHLSGCRLLLTSNTCKASHTRLVRAMQSNLMLFC